MMNGWPAGEAPLDSRAETRDLNSSSPERSAAHGGAPVPPPLESLLDAVTSVPNVGPPRLADILRATDSVPALHRWLESLRGRDKSEVLRLIAANIASIDRLINRQVNAILHHPDFQRLEASWRGVWYLVDQTSQAVERALKVDDDAQARIVIRLLSVSWSEIELDFDRSIDHDQSLLFGKIYSAEFGTPGGNPFGVMLADFAIHPRRTSEYRHDDVEVLRGLAKVAAASFCPTIVAAHPSLFGLDSFGELERQHNHAETFNQLDYLKWRTLRESEDSRFLGVVLPRVLMRRPYADGAAHSPGFLFHEDVTANNRQGYLWGNAVYAFGAVVARAYANGGWLADIRGVRQDGDSERGGQVSGLPQHDFGTDASGVASRFAIEVAVTDELERGLSELGFLPLCTCQDSAVLAFQGSASLQRPRKFDRSSATTNARLSSQLMHMLCVARFGHYVKVIARDKIGTFAEPADLQRFLDDWLVNYVSRESDAAEETKARYPLRDKQVEVRLHPRKPGAYECILHLSPHYQLDELVASVRLETEF